jgi:hypothetical protein
MGTSARTILFMAFTCILLLASNASAQDPGARDHADGFFLRMAAGFGYAQSKNDGFPLEFTGAPAELDIAIGAVVTENLAIHATLFGWLISDPDVDGVLGSGTASGDADMTAFGVGVTYYFMPVNIYLSASLGAGSFSATGDIEGESDSGLAGQLTAGKEWWVSNRWGLGVSGVFGFFTLPESTSSENWKGYNLAIMFSTTFN